ncbi:MAG: heme ABC exporter ATP-binding protein CcmA [Proteobacteria bacterium]|nr:heme ABC exporter ATP-binding protein CcmA [Pseudomonadota bacterium]
MATASLEVTDLACRRGGRRVFEHVSFTLGGGMLLALTGRNGSGKTTLLRALATLGRAEAGTVVWRDADIAWLGHLDGLKGDLTIAENIDVAERLRGAAPDRARVDHALAAFDLAPLAARPVRTLSAGQRRRAALARVAASRANAWLLDEPLNALDAPARAALHTVLGAHLAAGGLAIAATHAPLDIDGARTFDLGGAS